MGHADEAIRVEPSLRAWAGWLSQQLLDDGDSPLSQDLLHIAPQLYGMSPDGSYRLICAFAGGTKAFRGEQIQSGKPWLDSLRISRLLGHGLEVLRAAN